MFWVRKPELRGRASATGEREGPRESERKRSSVEFDNCELQGGKRREQSEGFL